ncbi:hypothetical protein [Streptomyces sp. SPB4]|uniref:hypothetical protein n=1 Tax=Streptomyces sp. SPB4 TaxID=2940553 RepID=UPI002476BFBF|nr:hypothetical protein [Streptomyces sp. SPB4]MDH6539788.1 hypothetical protein [Streptomyces sp. SPB4]
MTGTGRRLRPGTAVTPLRDGLHLRGRRGSVTLEGSAALPALWRSLERPLRTGGLDALLDGLEPGSPVRAAVDAVVAQLEAHDLLVAGPPPPAGDPGPVGPWLAVSAGRPAEAAAALAATRAEVVAAAVDGPLAGAAGRALEQGGLPVTYTRDAGLPEGRIHLRAHGPEGVTHALAAGLPAPTGYVTSPDTADATAATATALEARLAARPASGTPAADHTGGGGGATAALLGGAAAHRLLCAAAGLPDPAGEGDDDRLLPGLPAVLLVDARPPRAEYRTWVGPRPSGAPLAPATTLREALRRVAALGDGRCGVLPDPGPADLPQLPVPLASCAAPDRPGQTLTGGAPRLDLARLEVFCRAAELALGGAGSTVGASPGHALGRALRAEVARRAGTGAGRPPVAPRRWSGHPQARHWWTTLTARLAVPARLHVFRAAPGAEVYRAVVHRTGPDGPVPLGDAVEATPGDAAACAALAAVAAVSAAASTASAAVTAPAAGGRTRAAVAGAAGAGLAVAGAPAVGWEEPGWTGRWLADTAGREGAFQEAMSRLTGPPRPAPPDAPGGELAALLRSFGFTVLHFPEEAP